MKNRSRTVNQQISFKTVGNKHMEMNKGVQTNPVIGWKKSVDAKVLLLGKQEGRPYGDITLQLMCSKHMNRRIKVVCRGATYN